LNVAYILRYFPALTETFVLREVRALQDLGHQVVVVSMGEREDSAMVKDLCDVHLVRMPRGLRRISLFAAWLRDVVSGGPLRPETSRLRTQWMASHLRALGVERLHAHFAGEAAVWARDLARALDRPYTVTVHAVDLFKPIQGFNELLNEAEKVVTVCQHHAVYLAENHGVQASVVRMGVSRVAQTPVHHKAQVPLRLVAVARDVPKKGLDLLVGVVASFEGRVVLRVVGDAPASMESPWVQVGRVPSDEVCDALRAADVFVLPCRIAPDGDRDGIPVALMEAMAQGLPVVSTRIAGIPELVNDGVGWLLAPDDPDALRAALNEAMNVTTRALRGEEAWRTIAREHWTAARQAREMLCVWETPNP